jgi:hypothetical protein
LGLTTGCSSKQAESSFQSPFDVSEDGSSSSATTRVDVEKLPELKKATDVEITWQIPQQSVDGFVIRYGFNRNNLDQLKRVTTGSLMKYEDPAHGFVYRYVIPGVAREKTIYVSIAAYRGQEESEPTEVIEIGADK